MAARGSRGRPPFVAGTTQAPVEPPRRIVITERHCVVETDRPAGGRWIEVAPERFTGWVSAFAQPDGVIFRAADGAVAQCQVPFPPLTASVTGGPGQRLAVQAAGQIAGHALADRTVAVLLVRLGGYAAG